MIEQNWYITPSEFAGLIIDALEDQGYFRRNEKVHPEDLLVSFESAAKSIALALVFVGKNTPYKNAKEIRDKIKSAFNQDDPDGVKMYSDLYDDWKSTK